MIPRRLLVASQNKRGGHPASPTSKMVLGRLFAVSLAVLLLSFTASAGARDLPRVAPERVGLSPDRLARLTAHMNQAVTEGVMVGGLGLVARRGRVAYLETYGHSDREADIPMTADALFRIYSMTKPITGVAVMMLYEEGHFMLRDPIGRYLPALSDLEVALSTAGGEADNETINAQSAVDSSAATDGSNSDDAVAPPTVATRTPSRDGAIPRLIEVAPPTVATRAPSRQPTIRDLLTHAAGFTYGVFGDTEVDKLYRQAELMMDDMPLAEFVTRLGSLPLQYDPGTRWHYSVSVDVQGALVEAVSGMTFGEFLQSRLFGPLGMVDTSFVVPDEKWPRVAQLYSPADTAADDIYAAFSSGNDDTVGLIVADEQWNSGYREGAQFEGGGGGLVSTVTDYLRFCQMLLNGGELDGVRLLSPKTVALMTADHTGDLDEPYDEVDPGYGFGLGVAVALDPGAVGEQSSVGTYYWGGAAGTRFFIDPEEELIGIFMTQSIPHRTRLRDEFKNLVYQAVIE